MFKSSPGMGKGYNPSEDAPITSRPRASLGLAAFYLFPARAAQGQLSPISLAGQRKPSGGVERHALPFSLAARKDGPGRKPRYGRVAERSKAAVLKTAGAKASRGSNPFPSANAPFTLHMPGGGIRLWNKWSGSCWRSSMVQSIRLIPESVLVQVQPPVPREPLSQALSIHDYGRKGETDMQDDGKGTPNHADVAQLEVAPHL